MEARKPRGREAEAVRNDTRILEAARAVYTADPRAPIQAVAAKANVGIGALYRRYENKDALVAELCRLALLAYVEEAERAAADTGDAWTVFSTFLERVVDAGAGSLTSRLAGTFKPTPELFELGQRGRELNQQLLERAQRAGAVRADLTTEDLGLIYEQLAAIGLGNPARQKQLRRRYLAMLLAGFRDDGSELPGPPPGPAELARRWRS